MNLDGYVLVGSISLRTEQKVSIDCDKPQRDYLIRNLECKNYSLLRRHSKSLQEKTKLEVGSLFR